MRFSALVLSLLVLVVASARADHPIDVILDGKPYSCTPKSADPCWETCSQPSRGNSTSTCQNICG